MKITLAQTNPVVGDIGGNLKAIFDRVAAAAAMRADLVVFPEMCITGYPPRDLLERERFIEDAGDALQALVELSRGYKDMGIVVGLPVPTRREGGKRLANVAVLVAAGRILHEQEKTLLPTYDVFDELRYFDPAAAAAPVEFKGEKIGLTICEDAWNDPELYGRRLYDVDPVAVLAGKGASLLVNISASPFTVGKGKFRVELFRNQARRHGVPVVLVNQVGGNDELIFDGESLFVDGGGELRFMLPRFEEAIATVDTAATSPEIVYRQPPDVDDVMDALVLGTRDYFRKSGFQRAVVGLSGGIDSAVTLAVAAKALGKSNVLAVAMPSPYSSKASAEDAAALSRNLGVELQVVEITDIMSAYDRALARPFAGTERGTAEENVQARIRGNILMAYSNKFGYLVLATGNKSELAVGYCTLYGDMSGGLAVISDVPKVMVYRLGEKINEDAEIIPRRIFEKAPSAELKPNQTDQDTLPPYEILDAILDLYVEDGMPAERIVERGYEARTVRWVIDAVKKSEYKRKQAAPGLKVTSKAFGVGRRFPIAARYDV